MLARCGLLLVVVALSFAAPCHADRVYQMIDRPENQWGHTLKGTIITTDDAPNDSLLDVAEILRWEWTAAGPRPFSTNSEVLLQDRVEALGVQITEREIFLPIATFNDPGPMRLGLARETPMARGPIVHSISWMSVNTPSQGTSNIYSAGEQQSDFIIGRWTGLVDLPGPTFLIAVAIPEPATVFLLATSVLVFALRR